MKKRLLLVMLCVVLVLTSVSAVSAAPTGKAAPQASYDATIVAGEGDDQVTYEFKEVARNDRFVLTYDEASTYAGLTDMTTGQTWYTNPPISVSDDPYVEGVAKTDIRSALRITYTNSSMKTKDTNSYAGSVMKKAATMTKVDNGIRIDYNFKEAKITIPVQYTLTEDGFRAEILYKEIKDGTTVKAEDEKTEEDGSNTLNSIDFLMYFGAASETDKGYIVIPDGSGALINFNNEKNVDTMMYRKPFYGKDHAETTESDIESSRNEKISLPVFGMVKNGYGFLAEVVSGAENANLEAATAGNRLVGGYNIVYTSTAYRISYSLPLMGQISSETSNALFNAEDPSSLESYAIEYHFSSDNKADYISLADMYRNILLEREWLTKDEISDSFYVEVYGAVNKKKSFLGFVYTAREKLTTFSQAQTILQDLVAGGVDDIQVQYVNFSNDFFKNDMEIKLAPSSNLGGKKGVTSLLDYTSNNNINVSFAADFTTMGSSGNGVSTIWDAADAINISPIKVYPISLNGNTYNTAKRPYYLLVPEKYNKAVNTLMKSTDKYGYQSLYFDDEAMQLYSDLAPDGYQSERTSAAQAEQYARLAEAGLDLTFSNPNAYLYAHADHLVNIPVCSSKEVLFDMDVPFLQTVLRGTKNFSGESMNITDVSAKSFLRHLEYATDIRYAITQADNEALLNTDHTFLYSSTYDKFQDTIKERYAIVKEFGKAVGDATITAHERVDDVATVTYSNGAKVIVNYKDGVVTIDGTDYAVN